MYTYLSSISHETTKFWWISMKFSDEWVCIERTFSQYKRKMIFAIQSGKKLGHFIRFCNRRHFNESGMN
jgi:hypothetical protein